MNNEPVRHHYIPQFILRNFCFDDENHLYFQDAKSGKVSVKDTRSVFMTRNLYRDEINNPENPTKLESDFAEYEREIAPIIDKFVREKKIVLTVREADSLMLFLNIMGLRSERTRRDFFSDAVQDKTREFYSMYQKDGNLTDFWKRNLEGLVKCRSITEVLDSTSIDDPIKLFISRDVVGLFGKYIVIAETRGKQDLVIGDSYPMLTVGVAENGMKMPIYSTFPLSPNRALFVVSNGATSAWESVRVLNEDVLKKPRIDSYKQQVTFLVKRIYEREVEFLNTGIKENSELGWVPGQNRSRI
ncbi:MAG: DUF4238 domain-containing protein [Erysipelotrichaceae bacterium]|nr:DUF4238 domain-containing protein [Erysipelotrichaceae bacterium]